MTESKTIPRWFHIPWFLISLTALLIEIVQEAWKAYRTAPVRECL